MRGTKGSHEHGRVTPGLPAYVDWPLFPFEGELRVSLRRISSQTASAAASPAAHRAISCPADDDAFIWVDDHWRLYARDEPPSVPVLVILETRAHVDLDGLDGELAAQLGPMIVRLDRAIRSVGNVGRVHVHRWGDGAEHFHLWFYARPLGSMNMLGFGMPLWEPILPPIPESEWRANLVTVARGARRGRRTRDGQLALAYRSRSSSFRILPIGLRGISSTISSCSGIFCVARPTDRQCSPISASVSDSTPSASCTTAQHRSPVRGSGTPMIATSAILAMPVQHVLHLGGRDVLRVANDHILQSPRDPDVAGGQHQAEVAGTEEAVIVERVLHELGVRVRAEELRPEETQLTRFAGRALAAVRADDPDLYSR